MRPIREYKWWEKSTPNDFAEAPMTTLEMRVEMVNNAIDRVIANENWEWVYRGNEIELTNSFEGELMITVSVPNYHTETFKAKDIIGCIPDRMEISINNLILADKKAVLHCLINSGKFPYPYQTLK